MVGLVGRIWRRPAPGMEEAWGCGGWGADGCLSLKATPIINSHPHNSAF